MSIRSVNVFQMEVEGTPKEEIKVEKVDGRRVKIL